MGDSTTTSGSGRHVAVFCGASPGNDPAFLSAAASLGRHLAGAGLGLVYGGASIGLMGALADSVLSEGGRVIGVIPELLMSREIAHPELTELRIVSTLHERKAIMAELSSAFIAMPGGFGTLDELCEILTWAQLGIHSKPIGLLNPRGFFDGFLSFADHAAKEGFLKAENRSMLVAERTPEALLAALGLSRESGRESRGR